ncbi:unnamed protein product [Symbiodinium sp. KB8]|nr:unnamed protein product [Symbiodinium sp. KB8]
MWRLLLALSGSALANDVNDAACVMQMAMRARLTSTNVSFTEMKEYEGKYCYAPAAEMRADHRAFDGVASRQECEDECAADPECNFYGWYTGGRTGSRCDDCVLYRSCEARRESVCKDVGNPKIYAKSPSNTVRTASPNEVKGYVVDVTLTDMYCKGSELLVLEDATLEECKSNCSAFGRCQYFGFYSNSKPDEVAITEITEIPASTSGGPAGFSAVAFTANRKAVFSPGMDQAHICAGWDNTRVGILDLDTSQYETFELTDCNQDPPSPLPANGWGGAAAVGNKVVFAPAHHWWNPNPSKASIGVFDAGTPYSFNRIDIESDLASVGITDTRELFLGAVTIGSVVVFTPGRSVVGIFDPVTSQYRQVQHSIPRGTGSGSPVADAVAVGTKAVFCPFRGKNVVTFEPDTDTIHMLDISGKVNFGDYGFHGGAAVGNKVYCAPWTQDGIGVYDVEADTFDLLAVALFQSFGSYEFYAAAAFGDIVYLAPGQTNVLLALDTRDNSTTTISDHGVNTADRYSFTKGAADPLTKTLIFSPNSVANAFLISFR